MPVAPRRRALALAQDDGLQDPLLGATPDDQRPEAAEEVSAIVERAERSADRKNRDAEQQRDRQRPDETGHQGTGIEAPLPVLQVVMDGQENDNARRDEDDLARPAVGEEPGMDQDGGDDGDRVRHAISVRFPGPSCQLTA